MALLSGGIPRADLERAGAEAVYRDVVDLLDHLDDSPRAGPRLAHAQETPGCGP
ncbi:hypothetical protein [Streptomyces sp. MNU77]|uniref:hypothetical protein n=1 Tax=Streptomyces sp. MNU77 TaxID=1573406 RepID=UPI000A3F2495